MWLPKDERETLCKYHSYILNIHESMLFTNLSERVYNTTKNLIERGLINEIKEGGKEHVEYMSTWLGEPVNLKKFLSSEENMIGQTIILKLTLNGLDLSNKYDNWFTRTGLWFAEYKDHWLWLILGFLGGVLGALLVNWLSYKPSGN